MDDSAEQGFISGAVFQFKLALMLAYECKKNIEAAYLPGKEMVVITIDSQEYTVNVAGDSPNAVLYDIYRQAPDIFFL